MPISEDEYDSGRSNEPQSTMSKAELRKTHKPIMEKRRRARINHCLNEIKTLILEAMNKDPARHTKLEKADILEMAVKHLQNVQRQQLAIAMTTDSSVLRKFKNGFNECATEIDRYIGQIEGVDSSMKQRVSSHLQKCMNAGSSSQATNVGDQNNNPRIQMPLQLIPSRLPTGELALLVPNSSNMPYFPATVTATIQNRPSAFATVVSGAEPPKTLSPPVSPKNPSPQGFRPVLPKGFNDDHQVQQVSSTVPYAQPLEVKTLKFPITRKLESPKKPSDPLCVITNQNERYKQAHMLEETAGFPENAVKRRYPDSLLAVSEYFVPPPKIVKTQLVTPSVSDREDVTKTVPVVKQEPSSSNSNAEGSSDMWRPW